MVTECNGQPGHAPCPHCSSMPGARLHPFLAATIVVLPVLGLVLWLSHVGADDVRDGTYGCHTTALNRDFWLATVERGTLVDLRQSGSQDPRVQAFSDMDTHHGSGAFNVTINQTITATCESDD